MKRAVAISLLSLAAFVAIVLARLPASWVLPDARPLITCSSIEGSIWRGYCGGLVVQGVALGDATWQLTPARLLLGTVAAHVNVLRRDGSLHADIAVDLGGTVRARNVRAQLPLDPSIVPLLPSGLSGRARIDLTAARFTTSGVIERLEGRIEALDIVAPVGALIPVGSYAAVFSGAPGEPTARVVDLGGPLAVSGTLRLTRAPPGYEIQGYVTPREDAPPALVDAIEYLGTPDAEGRRSFALSGTF